MNKGQNMLKIITLMILSFFLLSCGKIVKEDDATKALSKHLMDEYHEEFEIENMYGTLTNPDGEVYYEADIIPSRYVGTGKYRDKYFWRLGQVVIDKNIFGEEIKYSTDTYGIVQVNVTANDYFMPKLEELFGKQVLPIFQIKTSIAANNGKFLDTMKLNKHATIGGGIYIFTRIDNLDQKEIFREKIYSFIQHMKKVDLFNKVDLAFYILDERCLTERFDREVGPKLIEAREELKTADEFIAYRKELIATLDEDFEKMTDEERLERIDRYDREKMLDTWGWDDKENKLNKYTTIYHNAFRSRKYLEVELRLREFKKLDYLSLNELKLLNTIKVDYKEYNVEKAYNQEWDGE